MRFVPALNLQLRGMIRLNEKWRYKEHTFDWWTDRAFFKHDSILVSAFYGIKDNEYSFREKYKIPKDVIFIGDSGGFQILTGKANFSMEDAVKWQNTNCDISIILDVPATKKIDGRYVYLEGKEFKDCLKKTINNAAYYDKHSTAKTYNVLHGNTLEKMNIWYEGVKDFSFDGWAMGIKPQTNPLLQSMGAMFLHEKGIKTNLHVLGIAGFNVLPTLAYLNSTIANITTDSSSFGTFGAIYRIYLNPIDPVRCQIPLGQKYENVIKQLPCDCSVCSISSVEDMHAAGTMSGGLVALHDLNVYLRYVKMLNALSGDKELLRTFCKANCDPATIQSFDFIDDALEKGIEHAYGKYMGQVKL